MRRPSARLEDCVSCFRASSESMWIMLPSSVKWIASWSTVVSGLYWHSCQTFAYKHVHSRDRQSFEIRFEFDSKVTCRLENSESASHTVCRHATNYAHSLFSKNINLCAVCSWDICLQLHFTCSCTAVARAHTQVPHDNRHWTCKRLPLILFEIRFERKFPIRRSISWKQTSHTHTHARARAQR